MTVKYHPAWGVAPVVLGAMVTFLGVLAVMVETVISGIIVLVLGILYLTRPYFRYEPGTRTVVVKAPIGPVERRFGESQGQQLVVEGNRIVCVRQDGQRKRPVSPIMANRNEWNAVLAQIQQGQPQP